MKMHRILFLSLCFFAIFFSVQLNAQDKNVAITDDANYTPPSSAMLDVKSDTKGFLAPRVSNTNKVTSPVAGLMVYQTSDKKYYYYDGTKWVAFGAGGGGTLNDAYNFGGAGRGRIINANAGTVYIKTATTPTDTSNALFAVGGSGAIMDGDNLLFGAGVAGQGFAGVFGSGAYGMIGSSTDADLGIGMYGIGGFNQTTDGTATGTGLYGQGYYGVLGEGVFGVRGKSLSDVGYAIVGIGGTAATDPNNLPTPENPWGIGVAGKGLIGIWGESSDPESGAGVWSGDYIVSQVGMISGGDLQAQGNLVVQGSKQFRIDHPLDPQNKYLKHFCLESPEVLNMYRGNVVLDANGEATVQLPDYFNAININYSYQLTAIGASLPNLYIKEKISGNTFKIAGGKSNAEVSWSVLAERNDTYMQNNPSEKLVEVNKKDVKTVNPVLFDKSLTKTSLIDESKMNNNKLFKPIKKHSPNIKKLNLK